MQAHRNNQEGLHCQRTALVVCRARTRGIDRWSIWCLGVWPIRQLQPTVIQAPTKNVVLVRRCAKHSITREFTNAGLMPTVCFAYGLMHRLPPAGLTWLYLCSALTQYSQHICRPTLGGHASLARPLDCLRPESLGTPVLISGPFLQP